jgi:hypothetical protein
MLASHLKTDQLLNCITDQSRGQPPGQLASAPNQQSQPSQGSNFGDSSGPIFSMYSKAAEEEDKNMADRWQKDADGILIFVSPRGGILLSFYIMIFLGY